MSEENLEVFKSVEVFKSAALTVSTYLGFRGDPRVQITPRTLPGSCHYKLSRKEALELAAALVEAVKPEAVEQGYGTVAGAMLKSLRWFATHEGEGQ